MPILAWKFIGVRGATIDAEWPDGRNISHQIPRAAAFHPTVIYIHLNHLGENDLGSLLPHEIVHNLVVFINRLAVACRPQRIIVSQLFDFPNNVERGQSSRYINQQMEAHWAVEANQPLPTRVQYWYHRVSVFGPDAAEHFVDGVHLDDRTMAKYCVSAGTIVSRCFNAVQREQR